jgi:hypothetical protein
MIRTVMLLLAVTFSPAAVAAQQPCTTDTRQVVDELYRHMLERPADDASVRWIEQLESGQLDVREVARQIATSPEHVQRFHRTEVGESAPYERSVARLYRHILGRQPDAAGQRAHAELAQRSGGAAVADNLIDSAEYDQTLGDWGVPGSGGIRYCPPRGRDSSQNTLASAVPLQAQRFRGMDRNNDAVITRSEWRGNHQSFDVHDWNNDGVLTGDEINEASARNGRTVDDEAFDRADRFEDLDANGNGRLELREWHGTTAAFDRLDQDHDEVLSRTEHHLGLDRRTDDSRGSRVIRVAAAERWTDTGIDLRTGDTLSFDARGTVRLSDSGNDTAGVGGAFSGRRAPNAPLLEQSAGALIAQIGNGDTLLVGTRRTLRALAGGRLYLGVNDDHLADNTGGFQVMVTVQRR